MSLITGELRQERPAAATARNSGKEDSVEKQNKTKPVSGREESYRLAKLIRAGNRELARQLNVKKSQKQR